MSNFTPDIRKSIEEALADLPPLEAQLYFLSQDRLIYVNSRYQQQSRLKAALNMRLRGILTQSEDELRKPFEDELAKLEAYIDYYDGEIALVQKQIEAEKAANKKQENES